MRSDRDQPGKFAGFTGRVRDGEAIFWRGRHIGFVVTLRCGQVDAILANGVHLGRHTTAVGAASAILARCVTPEMQVA